MADNIAKKRAELNAHELQPYIGYPQIATKPRQAGAATGFLEGASGLPSMQPKNPITDPNYEAYELGKQRGELANIAMMAVPGYAAAVKAAGPKAYDMLEKYMVKTGGIQPITAWHGTPYPFNKFELSEIGQGEGSQAFGHGVYLAENPSVAKGYQQALSGQMVTDKDLMDYFKPGEIRRKMGGYDKVISFQPATKDKSWHTVVQEVIKNKEGEWVPHPTYGRLRAHSTMPDPLDFKQNMGRELGPAGYLYKVDVPDEHIEKMVDWDLPFREQPQHIQEAFAKANPIAIIQKDPSNEFTRWLRQPDTAKVLQEMDIPGIKYLDRGSRFGNQDAKTQNYVVFDPDKSTKILERNGEPIMNMGAEE